MRVIILFVVLGAVVATGYVATRPHTEDVNLPGVSSTTTPSSLHATTTPSSSPKTSRAAGTQTPIPTNIGASTTPTPSVSSVVPSDSPTPTAITSVSPSTAPTQTQTVQTYTVRIENHVYAPSTLTVNRGDLVVFQAVDTFYSVVVDGRYSGRMRPGQQWTLRVEDFLAGTYQIKDAAFSAMRGTLIIQ